MKFIFSVFSVLVVMSGTTTRAVDVDIDEASMSGGDSSSSNLRGRGLVGKQPGGGGGPPGQNTYDCDEGCGLDEVGHGPPVCGVDGNTYFNECIAYCQDIDIARPGVCANDPPINPNDESYVRTGKVSKAEMDEFKAERFKFTAKRNFPSGKMDLRELAGSGGPESDKENQRPTPPGLIRARRVTYEGLEYVSDDAPEVPVGYIPETNPTEGIIGSNPEDPHDGRALSVLGEDTRTETNGFTWPNWRLAQMEQCEGDSCYTWCSASIVGPNAVLTNRHCVYNHDEGRWFVPERVFPGRHAGGYDPWGHWKVRYATTFGTSDWSYDVAILHMESFGTNHKYPIGQYMGTLGLATMPCTFDENAMRITGYPGDKPQKTMWTSGVCDDWYYSCGSRKVYHKCDTYGGNSGSAIRDNTNKVVAVHSHGAGPGGWNSGTAFTPFILSSVMNWAGVV